MRRNALVLAVLVILSLALSACGQSQPTAAEQPKPAEQPASQPAAEQPAAPAVTQRLSIVTGGTSGVYYVYGGGLAQVLSKHLPGVEATAEVTAASVENMNLLDQKSADLAFSLADTAYDAFRGQGKFQSAIPIRALAVLYTNYTQIVTMADSGIRSVADLKGKRVSTGAPNSGTELIAERLLRAAGMDPDADITRDRLGVGESAGALKDGKIDAFFWSGGLPTGGVLELASTPGVRIAMVPSAEHKDKLVAEYGPLYVTRTIPAGTYPNVDQDVEVVAVPNVLISHADMPEQLVYDILKTMFDFKDELGAVHPEAKRLNLEDASAGAPVDYHPGAVRYYTEMGVWKG